MKNYIFIFQIAMIFTLFSCDNNESILNENESVNGKNLLFSMSITDFAQPNSSPKISYPDHWYNGNDRCLAPGWDCMREIVVTAPPLSFTYNVDELDYNITNETLDDYFSVTGNYQSLFPGLYGPALDDLRTGTTQLIKVWNSTHSTLTYRIVLTAGGIPDYEDVY